MTLALTLVAAMAVVATVLALVVLIRRPSEPEAVSPEEIRALHSDIGRLMGRVEAGFETSARDSSTVRSAIDLLTHDSGRRGTWGEVTLRRLLEKAGLEHGLDFDTQVVLPGGRPDAIIHLGGGGSIVVDAKAPLDDLRRAADCDDDGDRATHLKAHAAAVRRHVRELAGRDYPSRLRTTFAPVVMYLPVEGAWEAAIDAVPDLGPEALNRGVHPASPRTLGLVLDLIKHHALTVNQEAATREILEDTRELLGRLDKHAGHLVKLGKALGGAVEAFNQAVGNAATRVLPATNRMAGHLGRQVVAPPEPILVLPHPERVPVFDAGRVA